MSRSAHLPVLDLDERIKLQDRAASRTLPRRDVERARIVLLSADGASDAAIARKLGLAPKTVWDAKSIAALLGISVYYVWRVLRESRIYLNKLAHRGNPIPGAGGAWLPVDIFVG